MKKILASILAAFTTPEAINAEKSLVIIAATRFAILVPAAAFLVDALVKALS